MQIFTLYIRNTQKTTKNVEEKKDEREKMYRKPT